MIENLPIFTGKTLSLNALLGLYMRLLDSISILNSKQGIRPCKGEQPKSFHRRGIATVVGVYYLCFFKVI